MAHGVKTKGFSHPGIPAAEDGSAAVVSVDSHITQRACAYPITPSANMGSGYQAEVANDKRNLWSESILFVGPDSEHSFTSTCDGVALAGGTILKLYFWPGAGPNGALRSTLIWKVAHPRRFWPAKPIGGKTGGAYKNWLDCDSGNDSVPRL